MIIKLKNNISLEILQDTNPTNPREDDNVTEMICFHNKYNLGDEHEINKELFNSWNELEEIIKKEGVSIIKPLYLYDHGNLQIQSTPFNCNWDSMRLGFIIITEKKQQELLGFNSLPDDVIDNTLETELNIYNMYLNGEVYGYVLSRTETCNMGHDHKVEIDSCWGFYTDNLLYNGMTESIPEEYIEEIEEVYNSIQTNRGLLC